MKLETAILEKILKESKLPEAKIIEIMEKANKEIQAAKSDEKEAKESKAKFNFAIVCDPVIYEHCKLNEGTFYLAKLRADYPIRELQTNFNKAVAEYRKGKKVRRFPINNLDDAADLLTKKAWGENPADFVKITPDHLASFALIVEAAQ